MPTSIIYYSQPHRPIQHKRAIDHHAKQSAAGYQKAPRRHFLFSRFHSPKSSCSDPSERAILLLTHFLHNTSFLAAALLRTGAWVDVIGLVGLLRPRAELFT